VARKLFGCEVPIDLDRKRNLKFKFRSYAQYQAKTGHSINKFFFDIAEASKNHGDSKTPLTLVESSKMSDLIGVDRIRDLLHVALIHEDPGLTAEHTEEIMDQAAGDTFDEKLGYIVEKISKAYLASKGIDIDKETPSGESAGRTEVKSNSTGS